MSTNAPSTGLPMAGPGQAQTIPKHILEHANRLPWTSLSLPTNITPEQSQKLLNDTKSKYVRALMQMELTRTRVGKVEAVLKERHEKGTPTPPDDLKRFQEQIAQDKKLHADAETYVKNIRAQFSQAGQANTTQVQGSSQPGRPQPMQPGSSGGVPSTHSMQVPTASIITAMDAAKTTQMAAANRVGSMAGAQQPQQPQQQQQQPQPSNQPQVQTPVTPSVATPGQPSHAASGPPPQVKVEPGANTQHPPPVNTALASASAAHIQSAGTPAQAPTRAQTPQSAQQPSGANVRPLTHAAAVNRANSSSNITGQSSNSASSMLNTPNMTGMASQSGHSHAHPQPPQAQTQTVTSKMNIPKTLHEKATAPPQPVVVGGGNTPGRPTYGGGNGAGGVMNQPVIAKMPVPQFDTEGDHVLSKKKLDELVRQVCGGGSPRADGNYLTPDVEEVRILTFVPSFFVSHPYVLPYITIASFQEST
ncbi:hypothetical protein GGR55DRAFT_633795, partial [Xylaria sp. FL0064]